jgi:hypothetical protein
MVTLQLSNNFITNYSNFAQVFSYVFIVWQVNLGLFRLSLSLICVICGESSGLNIIVKEKLIMEAYLSALQSLTTVYLSELTFMATF